MKKRTKVNQPPKPINAKTILSKLINDKEAYSRFIYMCACKRYTNQEISEEMMRKYKQKISIPSVYRIMNQKHVKKVIDKIHQKIVNKALKLPIATSWGRLYYLEEQYKRAIEEGEDRLALMILRESREETKPLQIHFNNYYTENDTKIVNIIFEKMSEENLNNKLMELLSEVE